MHAQSVGVHIPPDVKLSVCIVPVCVCTVNCVAGERLVVFHVMRRGGGEVN